MSVAESGTQNQRPIPPFVAIHNHIRVPLYGLDTQLTLSSPVLTSLPGWVGPLLQAMIHVCVSI